MFKKYTTNCVALIQIYFLFPSHLKYGEKMVYQHKDAESFEDLYIRFQAFHEKLKILAENYVQKNLAIFSHG